MQLTGLVVVVDLCWPRLTGRGGSDLHVVEHMTMFVCLECAGRCSSQ